MGLFDFIKKKRVTDTSTNLKVTITSTPGKKTIDEENIDRLLGEASYHKKNQEVDVAIEKLKAAFKLMPANKWYGLSTQTRCRLPQYLHLAGRNDEAWNEFNNLILFIGEHGTSRIDQYLGFSYVYDKMRLYLEREKRYEPAVVLGIEAYVFEVIGYHMELQAPLEYFQPQLSNEPLANETRDWLQARALKRISIL